MSVEWKDMKKILVVRFSSIGDIVLTSPVVRCLNEQIPGAEVHYLTKKENEPILRGNPNITRIWLYDGDFSLLIAHLRKERFDFIADLHRNFRSQYVRFRLGAGSATFPKLNVRKYLAVRFHLDLLPDVHIVDRYFAAVGPLGVKNDGNGLDYFIPAGEQDAADSLPLNHQAGYIAVVIGGKHATKIFPADRVAELCRRLDRPVVLLGSSDDRPRGEQIREAAGDLVYNACGRFSLNGSASLVHSASAVVTNDTGLMHVAAAFRKPVVSFWGNTVPGFGMYPYLPGGPEPMLAEVEGLRCRPCSKLGFAECPKKHFRCMRDIDLGPVVGYLRDVPTPCPLPTSGQADKRT